MNADKPSRLEESLTSYLAACDEALAAGVTVPALGGADTPAELQPLLEEGLECLQLLERVWPRHGSAASTVPAAPSAAGNPGPSAPMLLTQLGRFQVRRELGRGTYGVVFLADDPLLGRPVALKVPQPGALLAPGLRERFRQEARAAAGLDHPNLVPVHEAGEDGGVCYIVSTYCPGITLADWLRQRTDLVPARLAARLTATLAGAVEHAHQRGVVHRDLKPSNVMLEAVEGEGPAATGQPADDLDLVPRVTDFGLAKVLDEGQTAQTQSGAVVGTASYMAPEQAGGKSKKVGPAADVYALGAILYELLTGRPPFRAETNLETLLQVKSAEPVPPSRLRPRLPRDLDTICLRCLEKEPGKRYASAEALADDLRRWLNGEPIQARPVGRAERLWRWCRRKPGAAGLTASLAALLVTLGVAAYPFTPTVVRLLANQGQLEIRTDDRNVEVVVLRGGQPVRILDLRAEEKIDLPAGDYELTLAGPRADLELVTDQFTLTRGGRVIAEVRRLSLPAIVSPIRRFEGHEANVWSVAFSPDGRRALSGSHDRTVRLWDIETGTELRPFTGHNGPVESVAFTPDGRRLVSGGHDGTVRLWDVETGEELRRFQGHTNGLTGVAVSPDGRRALSSSADGTVRLWDLESGQELRRFLGHTGGVAEVALSPDGRRALSTGLDKTVRLWDVAGSEELRRLEGHGDVVWSVAFSPDGRLALSGSKDCTVRLWDVETGQELRCWKAHTDVVPSVTFSRDGRYALSGSLDRTVRLWDVQTGQELRRFEGHTGPIEAVAVSPDGRYALSGGWDKTMRLWELPSGKTGSLGPARIRVVPGDSTRPPSAAGAREPPRVQFSPPDGEIRHFEGHTDAVMTVAFSPDGRRVLSGAGPDGAIDPIIRLWDVETGKELGRLVGHTSGVFSVAFSLDGERALSGSDDKTVRLWDLQTGKELKRFDGHEGRVYQVVFGADGKHALSASADETVRLWDLESGRELKRYEGHANEVRGLALSPDGQRFLSGGFDHSVRLWEVGSGRQVRRFRGHKGWVISVAFSPDGRRALSASFDKTVRLWDVETGAEIRCFKGHDGPAHAAAFSPDGRRILSGSYDQTIRLWDVETGTQLRRLLGYGGGTLCVVFSPDGRRALSSHDRIIRLWEISE